MKSTLPLLLLFFLSISAYGQSTGEANVFTYDGAGQRIQRRFELSWSIRAVLPDSSNDAFDVTIKAYPNPTADYVIVENPGWQDEDKAVVKVYDISGKLISTSNFTQYKDNVPFKGLPPATYQLHYYMHNKLIASWKIVKY